MIRFYLCKSYAGRTVLVLLIISLYAICMNIVYVTSGGTSGFGINMANDGGGLGNSPPVRLSIDDNRGGVIDSNSTVTSRSKSLSHVDLCDGELLAERMNTVDWEAVSQINETAEGDVRIYEEHILPAIESLIVDGFRAPPATEMAPPAALNETLDCTQSKYEHIFNGRRRGLKLKLMNFLPVGYNLPLLEARLHTLHDLVDYFVLFESPNVQGGMRKPLYLKEALASGRFVKFRSKMVHFIGDPLDDAARAAAHGGSWETEKNMRRIPLAMLRERMASLGINNVDEWLVIGGDGDEIPTRTAIHHLASCELCSGISLAEQIIYFGGLYAKNNLMALKRTQDGECASGGHGLSTLRKFVSGTGPAAQALSAVLIAGQFPHIPPRAVGCPNNSGTLDPGKVVVLPVGSAVHLSASEDPTQKLMKSMGTIETFRDGKTKSIRKFIAAGLRKEITGKFVVKTLVHDDKWLKSQITDVMRLEDKAVAVWKAAIPWFIRENPERYCWELPGKTWEVINARGQ